MEELQEITIADKIRKALDGRTQNWLVKKVLDFGTCPTFTDVKLSRRMQGMEQFTSTELRAISKILKIKL